MEKISLCMIVKNEEKNIEKVLSSVYKYVDEIVIVDTGSVDKTKEVAKRYTQNILDFKWCDDFAAARNFSIQNSKNDWILIIDADEVVIFFDRLKINDLISQQIKCVGRLKRVNAFESESGEKKYIERVNRLFNKQYFHYEGIIHEQVVGLEIEKYETFNIPLEIDHIGYTKEVIGRTKKIERNLSLLKKALIDAPKDPYLNYQIGKTYFMGKKYTESIVYFESALEGSLEYHLEYVHDLVESYGYALLNCQEYDKATHILDYKKYYEKSPDFQFLVGLIMMNLGKFEESINYFSKCQLFEEGKLDGVTTYMPTYNIGVIKEVLGDFDQALLNYIKCIEYIPSITRIEGLLGIKKEDIVRDEMIVIENLINKGYLLSASYLADKALNTKRTTRYLNAKGLILLMEKEYEEAMVYFYEALSLNHEDIDSQFNLAYLFFVQGLYEQATKWFRRVLESSNDPILVNDVKKCLEMINRDNKDI